MDPNAINTRGLAPPVIQHLDHENTVAQIELAGTLVNGKGLNVVLRVYVELEVDHVDEGVVRSLDPRAVASWVRSGVLELAGLLLALRALHIRPRTHSARGTSYVVGYVARNVVDGDVRWVKPLGCHDAYLTFFSRNGPAAPSMQVVSKYDSGGMR